MAFVGPWVQQLSRHHQGTQRRDQWHPPYATIWHRRCKHLQMVLQLEMRLEKKQSLNDIYIYICMHIHIHMVRLLVEITKDKSNCTVPHTKQRLEFKRAEPQRNSAKELPVKKKLWMCIFKVEKNMHMYTYIYIYLYIYLYLSIYLISVHTYT